MGESITDAEIAEGILHANTAREVAMTSRTKCGVSVGVRVHGRLVWQSGFNIEFRAYNGYHAEEVAGVGLIDAGKMAGDFEVLVERYQDASHNIVEHFPGCPTCWSFYNNWGNKDMLFVVADGVKETYRARLKDMQHVAPPGLVYPSDTLRAAKPLRNFRAGGDAPLRRVVETMKTPTDIDSLVRVALDARGRGLTFEGYDNLLHFDAVAFGMADGRIFGGFPMQSYGYKGYRPEEVGAILASLRDYRGADYRIVAGIVPSYVQDDETRGFLASITEFYSILREFTHDRIKLVAANNKGEIVYPKGDADGPDLRVRDVLRHTGESERFLRRYSSEVRPYQPTQSKIKVASTAWHAGRI